MSKGERNEDTEINEDIVDESINSKLQISGKNMYVYIHIYYIYIHTHTLIYIHICIQVKITVWITAVTCHHQITPQTPPLKEYLRYI
jgi:hypothetical protein